MSIQTTINYNNALDFSYDNTKIVVSGADARLLTQVASDSAIQNFDNDTGFTYDNTKLGFAAGVVSQLDQTPANSVFANTFSDFDKNWDKASESLTGMVIGAATINTGRLLCPLATPSGVAYIHTITPLETWKFIYTPNYTGPPPSNYNVITSTNGIDSADKFFLTHSPSGDSFRISLWDNTGAVVIATATTIGLGGIGLTAGVEYEIELTFDSVTGVMRMFLDGNLQGTLSPGAWSRGGLSRVCLGANVELYNLADAYFDDLIVFSDIQHTASYVKGYTIPLTIYTESNLILPTYTSPSSLISLTSFVATILGNVRYVVDGKYWDGSAWTVSGNIYMQATTYADMQANIGSLSVTGATTINMTLIFPDVNTSVVSDTQTLGVTRVGDYFSESAITHNTILSMSSFISLTETIVVSGSDTVGHVIVINSVGYYHDGISWVLSNSTLAQSNTLLEVQNNLSSLPVSTGEKVQVRLILSSADGSSTPALSQIITNHIYAITVGCNPAVTAVYGCILDNSGNPIEGAKISVDGDDFFYTESSLTPGNTKPSLITRSSSMFSDSSGEWVLDTVETATDSSTVTITIEYKQDGKTIKNRYTGLTIPLTSAIPLGNIVNP